MNFSKLLKYTAAFLRLYSRWLFAVWEKQIFVSEKRSLALTRQKTGFSGSTNSFSLIHHARQIIFVCNLKWS
jgi:hypothetical protein